MNSITRKLLINLTMKLKYRTSQNKWTLSFKKTTNWITRKLFSANKTGHACVTWTSPFDT